MKWKLQSLFCSCCPPEIICSECIIFYLRVSKSWWRDESFVQPSWSTKMESMSWWRTVFRQWRERRGTTQRPTTSLCLSTFEGQKLWCHRCAITNVTCMCSLKEAVQNEWTRKMRWIILNNSWTEHEMKDETLSHWLDKPVFMCIYLFCLWVLFLYALIDAL